MKFLIIDDSSVDARALTSALQNFGHSVDCLEDTEHAIGAIESGNYQAVFLDVVMPERDGYKWFFIRVKVLL
jgi:CheY-like chemotaxis protein